MTSSRLLFVLFVAVAVPLVAAQDAAFKSDPPIKCASCDEWNAPHESFRVFGNTYYVGVAGLSSVLITSAQATS